MRDFIEGIVGAIVALSIPIVLGYMEYRWQEKRKPSNAIFRHVESVILDKFNRR